MCRLALEITGAVLHMCLGFPFFTLKVPFCTWDYRCRFAHVFRVAVAVLHMCLGFPFCILEVPFCTWDFRCRFAHVFRVTVFTLDYISVLQITSAVLHLGLQAPFCTRVFRVAVLHITISICTLDYRCLFAHVFRVFVLYLGLHGRFTHVIRVAVLHITNAVLQLGLQVSVCTCV